MGAGAQLDNVGDVGPAPPIAANHVLAVARVAPGEAGVEREVVAERLGGETRVEKEAQPPDARDLQRLVRKKRSSGPK